MKNLSQSDRTFLITQCRKFYQHAIWQLQTRFVFDDDFYDIITLVQPENARQLNPRDLSALYQSFPVLSLDVKIEDTESEWRSHSSLSLADLGCQTKDELNSLDPTEYWKRVFSLKKDDKTFSKLEHCIAFLFSMPFSNVPAEREFSVLKLIKTAQRNSLHNVTVSSLMRIKHWLTKLGKTASSVEFNEYLLQQVRTVKANRTIDDPIFVPHPPLSIQQPFENEGLTDIVD